jgi:hypothetical protein
VDLPPTAGRPADARLRNFAKRLDELSVEIANPGPPPDEPSPNWWEEIQAVWEALRRIAVRISILVVLGEQISDSHDPRAVISITAGAVLLAALDELIRPPSEGVPGPGHAGRSVRVKRTLDVVPEPDDIEVADQPSPVCHNETGATLPTSAAQADPGHPGDGPTVQLRMPGRGDSPAANPPQSHPPKVDWDQVSAATPVDQPPGPSQLRGPGWTEQAVEETAERRPGPGASPAPTGC